MRPSMRGVVITGMGIVSPIGNSVEEFRRCMFMGDSGLKEIRGWHVAENFPVGAAGVATRERLDQPAVLAHRERPRTPDFWRLAGLATEEAIRGLPPSLPVDAIIYGAFQLVDFSVTRDSLRARSSKDLEWDTLRPDSTIELVREIVEKHGHGPIADRDLVNISNACVSSNQAIGMAFQRIRSGQWSRAVVGSVHSRYDAAEILSFNMLGTLSTSEGPAAEASRPFSKDRSGFVIGEGAATLVLEDRDSAEIRGAEILGQVTGYATTSDAYRVTDGRPDGKAASKAMEEAIRDAGLTGEQIDAISAHGTSTRLNDKLETLAIKQALGAVAKRVPVISLKSQTGHSLIAAGALEAVASLLMLREQRLAPTINYKEYDPECDLDYVPNESRSAALKRILSNSFGFGGQNACVVFESLTNRGLYVDEAQHPVP